MRSRLLLVLLVVVILSGARVSRASEPGKSPLALPDPAPPGLGSYRPSLPVLGPLGECPSGGWSYSNLRLNGLLTTEITVTPGQAIRLQYGFMVWNGINEAGRVCQIYAGLLKGAWSQVIDNCAYSGVPAICPNKTQGTFDYFFNAPSQEGDYQLIIGKEAQLTCDAAKARFPMMEWQVAATIHVSQAVCQGGWSYSSLLLNGRPITTTTVMPGQAIHLQYNYEVWNGRNDLSRVCQIYAGLLRGAWSQVIDNCAYSGVPAMCPNKTAGSFAYAFDAPTQEGDYQLIIGKEAQLTCDAAKARFPMTDRQIAATIRVSQRGSGTCDLEIFPSPKTVRHNEVFTLTIMARVGSQSVAGVSAYLSFDPSILRVVDENGQETDSIIAGSTLPQTLVNQANNGQGQIIYQAGMALGGSPATADFSLATMRFKSVTLTAGSPTTITFGLGTDAFDPSGNSAIRERRNGSVRVTSGFDLRGRVSLQGRGFPPSPAWNGYPLTVTLYTTGTTSLVGTFPANLDASGQFTISGLLSGTYDVKVKNSHSLSNLRAGVVITSSPASADLGTLREGDVNNDDRVNMADYVILATAYGKSVGQPGYDARADFNGNGAVNMADYVLLATSYGRQGPIVLASASRSLSGLERAEGVPMLIEPATGDVWLGEVFTVSIKINAGSQPVAGAVANVGYDPGLLRVVDADGHETDRITAGSALLQVMANAADNSLGRITYQAGIELGGSPAMGDLVLALICFKAIATTPEGGTPITFEADTDIYDIEGNSVLGATIGGTVNAKAGSIIWVPVLLTRHS